MGIPLSGATQSAGGAHHCNPRTYYEYRVTTSGRTATKIHVKVQLWMRMENYGSFFTYAIGHDCWVRGGSTGAWKYAYTKPKWNRHFWGHQDGLGSVYSETRNGWVIDQNQKWAQWDGRHWNGPFTVFDQDVPIDVDESNIQVCPCITRPNIAYERLQILHWYGKNGEWRPGASDKINSGYYGKNQKHGVSPEHAAFLNNRYEANLDGFKQPGAYARPAAPAILSLTPTKIDVADQNTQQIKAVWKSTLTGGSYTPYISLKADHSDKIALPKMPATTSNSVTLNFIPPQYIKRVIEGGENVYFGVLATDAAGVEAAGGIVWAKTPVAYYENPSYAPTSFRFVGRKKVNNELFFKGESTTIYYEGLVNGSYPIARLEWVRIADNQKVIRALSGTKNSSDKGEVKYVVNTPGVARPNTDYVWELRAYNTRGQAVYAKNGKWARVSVHYYGGTIYIYDYNNKWREGVAWVYDGKKWREAEAVYIYTQKGWKTL